MFICGLGGSGIGGTIVNNIVSTKANIPITATKDYSIPNFVLAHPCYCKLLLRNTEETLMLWQSAKQKGRDCCNYFRRKIETIAEEREIQQNNNSRQSSSKSYVWVRFY